MNQTVTRGLFDPDMTSLSLPSKHRKGSDWALFLDITIQSANFGRNAPFLSIYLFIYLFIVMIKGTVILQDRKRKKKDNYNWLLTSCQRLTADAERRRGSIRVHCLRSPCPRLTQTFGFYFFIVFSSNNCLSLVCKKAATKNPNDLFMFISVSDSPDGI